MFIHFTVTYGSVDSKWWLYVSSVVMTAKTIIIKHCFSNEWISMNKSTNLFNECDLAHCEAWSLYHPFENKDTLFRVEVVFDLSYELCYCVDISVNNIPTKPGHLVQWHYDYFSGSFKLLGTFINRSVWNQHVRSCMGWIQFQCE